MLVRYTSTGPLFNSNNNLHYLHVFEKGEFQEDDEFCPFFVCRDESYFYMQSCQTRLGSRACVTAESPRSS